MCDLTAEGVNGESGDVAEQGEVPDSGSGVLGASKDGSSVYFVANGALTAGAIRGDCVGRVESLAGRKCNLYVRRHDGNEWTPPKLIAVLSNEDSPDWGGSHGGPGELRFVTSRVSPSGRWLAFMSRESLTGYDNEDVTSKAPGERMDEEVFLYDVGRRTNSSAPRATRAASGRPACSIPADERRRRRRRHRAADRPRRDLERRRTGRRPLAGGNVPGWTSAALATAVYQSRYLSDSGRLFFNSPDPLVPAASSAKSKSTSTSRHGVGSCASDGGCLGLISSGTSDRTNRLSSTRARAAARPSS